MAPEGTGLWHRSFIVRRCSTKFAADASGSGSQTDAAQQTLSANRIVSAAPPTAAPYYDNIGYADLSDFFASYVWLRRSLKPVFPELFATLAVPKAEELVATSYRHGGKERRGSLAAPQRNDSGAATVSRNRAGEYVIRLAPDYSTPSSSPRSATAAAGSATGGEHGGWCARVIRFTWTAGRRSLYTRSGRTVGVCYFLIEKDSPDGCRSLYQARPWRVFHQGHALRAWGCLRCVCARTGDRLNVDQPLAIAVAVAARASAVGYDRVSR